MLNSLLQTKFYRPHWDVALVARSHLVARLNDVLHRQLTLITAPVGFGKTMLVSEWLATLGVPNQDTPTRVSKAEFVQRQTHDQLPHVCWLALDEGDNDPVRFFAHFMAALRVVAPSLGQLAELLLQALTDEVIDRQPRHLRDFLLHTSLLERLCAPLCDALQGTQTALGQTPRASPYSRDR